MCGSMVYIRSEATEIRRGKKQRKIEERKNPNLLWEFHVKSMTAVDPTTSDFD